jgi:hypothetical protein
MAKLIWAALMVAALVGVGWWLNKRSQRKRRVHRKP